MFIIGTPNISFASNQIFEQEQTEYEQTQDQINFDYLSVLVVDRKDVVVDIDPTISAFKRNQAKNEKEKYDAYIKENQKIAGIIYDILKKGENLCVLSYTEAPIVMVEDRYEHIKKDVINTNNTLRFTAFAAGNAAVSDPSPQADGNFELLTIITRTGSSNPYNYTALTMGVWDTSVSMITGKNKPSNGDDFVLQACPTVTSTSDFGCDYNYNTNGQTTGQEGVNFYEVDGFDSWVAFAVEDDPLGLAQLQAFGLTQTFIAKETSGTKKINSYYVHTWQTMDVDVTVSGVAGISAGEPATQVGLNITPTKKSMWWKVHNSVSYNW